MTGQKNSHTETASAEVRPSEWLPFRGGELEGPRPKVLCPRCRERLQARRIGSSSVPLCFQCYRAGLDRERALRAAGQLNTASDARFQYLLPFAPVNQHRLSMLRAERATAREASQAGAARFDVRCRRAQIAARRVLNSIETALAARGASPVERQRVMASASHAAELQFPEAWLPFVVSC